MKGKLTRVNSSHKRLRTDEVVGDFEDLPCEGYCFEMSAPPLDPKMDIRWIVTSPVQKIELDDGKMYRFATENSTYKLEVLE
jgi:hypothetical protein